MKFTMQCRDPSHLRILYGRVNNLPYKGFDSGTCLLSGVAWTMPDKVELTIDHSPDGFGDKYPLQSFRMIDAAERRKPGRPKGT